jgi:hypothetical protein
MQRDGQTTPRLRWQDWLDNPQHLDLTARYLEPFVSYGVTPEELRARRPIPIAQSAYDLVPCNRDTREGAGRRSGRSRVALQQAIDRLNPIQF